MLNGKRMATAAIKLPERWQDDGEQGRHGLRRYRRSAAMVTRRANIC